MSEPNEITISLLYSIVQREAENDSIQELNQNLYSTISNFLGKLKREEYDSIEGKIKDEQLRMATELTQLLLDLRLDKATQNEPSDLSNLLDEEKFILDSEDEKKERREMILSATINGKEKFLESISLQHKTRSVVVRFLQGMDQIVGVDLEKYGPFNSEDIATIPYENAQALIAKKVATKVRWED